MAALTCLAAAPATADDKTDEYRLTLFPTHSILGRRDWIAIGYLGYVSIPENETEVLYLGAGAIWKFARWGELWGVVIGMRTESDTSTDIDELRPLLGFKANFAKVGKTTWFNFARVEYRIQDRETGEDSEYFRVRDRVGFERPSWYQPQFVGTGTSYVVVTAPR